MSVKALGVGVKYVGMGVKYVGMGVKYVGTTVPSKENSLITKPTMRKSPHNP